MNFGALVCKPNAPLCTVCPLRNKCFANQHHQVPQLPVRTKKQPIRDRYFHFLVLQSGDKILLIRRMEKDIWNGLYAPPLMEAASTRSPRKKDMISQLQLHTGRGRINWSHSSAVVHQQLSHQALHGRFHFFTTKMAPTKLSAFRVWVSKKTAVRYGKPKMVVTKLWE
jgi:A/G-specific adenine glycosylase